MRVGLKGRPEQLLSPFQLCLCPWPLPWLNPRLCCGLRLWLAWCKPNLSIALLNNKAVPGTFLGKGLFLVRVPTLLNWGRALRLPLGEAQQLPITART